MTEINTLADLVATALAAERNAERAYSDLASNMTRHGNESLARIFQGLADEERSHAVEIERLAARLDLTELPECSPSFWRLEYDELLVDRDAATNPHIATPYRALAYAVQNEDLAFKFYSYIAATVEDDRMRQFAEAFAQEELNHSALLRRHRRQLYHAARGGDQPPALPGASSVETLADLVLLAGLIEHKILDRLEAVKEPDAAVSECLQQTRVLIERLHDAEQESTPATREVAAAARDYRLAGALSPEMVRSDRARSTIATELELAFGFYDDVVRVAQQEDVALRAQDLTEAALNRILLFEDQGVGDQ